MEIAYLIIYVPGPDEPKDAKPSSDSDEPFTGSFEVKEEVPIDLKGNPLSEADVKQRQQLLEAQKNESGSHRSRSASSTVTLPAASPSQGKPRAKGSCCSHNKAVAQENQEATQPESAEGSQVLNKPPANLPASALFHGCNCGAACSCAFCPQHPNNHVSQNLARQHANVFINHHQLFNANQSFMQLPPDFAQDASCMGARPEIGFNRGPLPENLADLQQLFSSNPNSGGFVMAYPVETHRNTPAPQPPDHAQANMRTSDTAASSTAPLPLDDSNWEFFNVGDATVAGNPLGHWPQTERGEQEFLNFDFADLPDLGVQDGVPANGLHMDSATANHNEHLSGPSNAGPYNGGVPSGANMNRDNSEGTVGPLSTHGSTNQNGAFDDIHGRLDEMFSNGSMNEPLDFDPMFAPAYPQQNQIFFPHTGGQPPAPTTMAMPLQHQLARHHMQSSYPTPRSSMSQPYPTPRPNMSEPYPGHHPNVSVPHTMSTGPDFSDLGQRPPPSPDAYEFGQYLNLTPTMAQMPMQYPQSQYCPNT